MTRIAIDLRMYRHSGIGRYLRNLLPPLLPLLQASHIRVIAPPALIADAKRLHDQRLEVFATDAPVYSIAEQLLPLKGAFQDTQLLWVPHYNVPILYRGPLVVTIHDIAPLALSETLGNPVKRAYARLLTERATRHATAILSVSDFTARELETTLGVDPGKITVTYQGLEGAWPSTAQPHCEPDGAPYLLYVGNVKPNKNLGRLLEAFAKIQHQIPHRLVLAGRIRGFGTSDDAVLQRAASLEIACALLTKSPTPNSSPYTPAQPRSSCRHSTRASDSRYWKRCTSAARCSRPTPHPCPKSPPTPGSTSTRATRTRSPTASAESWMRLS